nr:hypothetical protein GCM10020185_03650 [Pseudomonas brassicacearum subsp. brassicacearum]
MPHMDKWIELVKAKMKELRITQVVLAERLGMSQGGVGHWLTRRRQPSVEDMNRVLRELGLEFLEVAMVIREPDTSTDEGLALAQKYNPYFRYPVSEWHEVGEVREGDPGAYSQVRYELTDYHALGGRVLAGGGGRRDDRTQRAEHSRGHVDPGGSGDRGGARQTGGRLLAWQH